MKRSRKNISIALPQLSRQTQDGRNLVLQDAHDQAASAQASGVFTPSALRSHKSPISTSTNRMFAAVLFGLFIIMLLLSFLVGINVYRALDTMAESESTQRLEQSFLANTIHSNDLHDALATGEGPEGKALVLRETVDGGQGYETRIYAYNGSVVQEYSLAESPYAPEKAIPLFDSDLFDFSYDRGLLTIWTDNGKADVALRSAGEASL